MSQSFVARVRGTVRKSLESSDEIRTAMENAGDTTKPNVRLPKVVVGLKELDPEELAGAGARAIFEPLGNILSAKFVGVNKSFCDMFGFDRSDLPTSTFKIMQGPLTDTKHLQEVRARGGSLASTYPVSHHCAAKQPCPHIKRLPDGTHPKPAGSQASNGEQISASSSVASVAAVVTNIFPREARLLRVGNTREHTCPSCVSLSGKAITWEVCCGESRVRTVCDRRGEGAQSG